MFNFLDNDYKVTLGKENFDYEMVKDLFTEYFLNFDYVLGDYSYGKIRLKGFYDSNNKKVKKINNIKNLDEYINNYCSLGTKVFLLEKQKNRSIEKVNATLKD